MTLSLWERWIAGDQSADLDGSIDDSARAQSSEPTNPGRPIALEEYSVTTGPVVTLNDIAAFHPVSPVDITEPNGGGASSPSR